MVLNWRKKNPVSLQFNQSFLPDYNWCGCIPEIIQKKIWQVLASLSLVGHTWPCSNWESSWHIISPYFPQNVWPSKYIRACKRTEIHLVSCPESGGIGSWDQGNRAYFRKYFNPSTTFQTYDAGNKAYQKVMKLIKMFMGKGQSGPPEKGVMWP